ncbi:MAG: PD-(D/E)XK nuclease family transposase, partial [Bacteroidota bacterium]
FLFIFDQMKTNTSFISILSDYGFKVTFADESDTLFLKRSLQALTQHKTPIEQVHFLRNEFEGQTKDSRKGVYDLACEDERGTTFIVEMQLGPYKNYIHRSKFYAFQKFNTFVRKGNYFYEDLPKIYCVGLLARNLFRHSKQYYHFATLKNQIGEELDDQITHIIIEISKFNLAVEDIQSDLDKLLFLMKNSDKIQKNSDFPSFLTEDWLEKALKRLDEGNMTPDQRMFYNMAIAKNASIIQMEQEEREIWQEEILQKVTKEVNEKMTKEVQEEIRQQVTKELQEEIRQQVTKELQEGIRQQVTKELQEGIRQQVSEEIRIELKKAYRALFQTAQKLKNRNMPLEEIAAITGLDLEALRKL